MNEIEKNLWDAKVADKREERQRRYVGYLAELNPKGMLGAESVPAELFKIGAESIGDLNLIYREIIEDSWKSVSPADISAKEQVDKNEGETFILSERKAVEAEIKDLLEKRHLTYQGQSINTGKQILLVSSEVHRHRLPVFIGGLAAFKRDEHAQRKRKDNRWVIERTLQGIALVVLVFTAKTSWNTYFSSREEFYLRNRPYLSLSAKQIPQMRDEVSGTGNVEIGMVIHNNGEVPAVDVVYYALGIADGEALFGVNTKKVWVKNQDLQIEFVESQNSVIFPKMDSFIYFTMPKVAFRRLLQASNGNAGITIKIDYCGPWGESKTRQYSTQVSILPWLDGNKIKYKSFSEKIY